MSIRVICFRHCRFVCSTGYAETVFPDGAFCPALFVDDDPARQHAAELGYGTDTRRMHIEHELSHTLLAEARGLPYSPTLRNVAVPGTTPDAERADEEWLVFAFQRYVTRGDWEAKLTEIPALTMVAERLRELSRHLQSEPALTF